MTTDANHSFLVRVLSEDGELILEDSDFAEDARFDWFSELLKQSDSGDVVQLIDAADNRVICEEIKGN